MGQHPGPGRKAQGCPWGTAPAERTGPQRQACVSVSKQQACAQLRRRDWPQALQLRRDTAVPVFKQTSPGTTALGPHGSKHTSPGGPLWAAGAGKTEGLDRGVPFPLRAPTVQRPHETDRRAQSGRLGTRMYQVNTSRRPFSPTLPGLPCTGSAQPVPVPLCVAHPGPTPTPTLSPNPTGSLDGSGPSNPAPSTELGLRVLAVAGALGTLPPSTLLLSPIRGPTPTRECWSAGRRACESRRKDQG